MVGHRSKRGVGDARYREGDLSESGREAARYGQNTHIRHVTAANAIVVGQTTDSSTTCNAKLLNKVAWESNNKLSVGLYLLLETQPEGVRDVLVADSRAAHFDTAGEDSRCSRDEKVENG